MSKDIKTNCYSGKCGPIVQTGFTSNWYICKSCNKEISEKLAEQIKEWKEKQEARSGEDMDIFGYGGYIPNGHDDGFY